MTGLLVLMIFVGLAAMIVVRNFFVQMISFKLTLDAIFLLFAHFNQHQQTMLAMGWILMSVGMLFIFLMMVVSLRKLSAKNDLNTGEEDAQC